VADTAVRTARLGDRGRILAIVREAFGQDRDPREEIELVERVWSLPAYLPDLELVAERDGTIVGHVLHSVGDVDGRAVAALAPLAVDPAHQRTGVGGMLLEESIARADAAGYPLIALLGHWTYYPRFGFEPGLPIGITPLHPELLLDPRAFMIRRLSSFDDGCRGRFLYAWELAE
jgi:putative acetyltransferase